MGREQVLCDFIAKASSYSSCGYYQGCTERKSIKLNLGEYHCKVKSHKDVYLKYVETRGVKTFLGSME